MRFLRSKPYAFAVVPLAVAAIAGFGSAAQAAPSESGPSLSEYLGRKLPHNVRTTGPRTTAPFTKEQAGAPASGEVHAAAARAKPWDVNGDSYPDMVVGAPGESLGSAVQAGAFHVMYGGPTGVTATGSKVYSQNTSGVPGSPEHDDFMGDVQASDDFNADGFADVAVAVGGENGNGRVYVFYGSATGLSTSGIDMLANYTYGDGWFGYAMDAGDVNGDGYGDLVASDPVNGMVKLIPGAADGLQPGSAHDWYGYAENGYGMAVAVGDLDADGRDDVVIGEPFADPMGKGYPTGQAWAYYSGGTGSQQWHKDSYGIKGYSTSPGADRAPDLFGMLLAIGDFNADGVGDLAAGAPGSRVTFTSSGSTVTRQDAGTVNVIYGSATGLTPDGDEYLHQAVAGVPGTPGTGDLFGLTLAAGDANGDGDDELAVFSRRENSVTVMNGASGSGIEPVSAKAISQNTSGVPGSTEYEDQFGAALRFVDFANDSYADLAIGSPGENSWAGCLTVLKGTSGGITASGAVVYSQDHSAIPGASERDDMFGSFF